VKIDAVGNVVGRYKAGSPGAKTLMTGSHYDTVRNGGQIRRPARRLHGPWLACSELSRQGQRLPFDFEVIGFAEEEGQRYKATFLAPAR
jgi:N-carbamoyl-L-amino-acid hydrolase